MISVPQPMNCSITEDSQLTINSNHSSHLTIRKLLHNFINDVCMSRFLHGLFVDALDTNISWLEKTCHSHRNKVYNNVLVALTHPSHEFLGMMYLVFAGPVHRTEKNRRTELNRTMVRSIFRLQLPEFGAIPVAGCRVSKIF